ncbi:MAG: glutathione peroxidase [Bacteroidales bacterium]|nr:glutathione peroxidase [Bacteroidales bacterium]
MKQMIAIALCTVLLACGAQKTEKTATIYDFKTVDNSGKEIDMSQYRGKVLMIVNTASKCGFTPQFEGLEKLHEQYKDRGLIVIGFPCNQFGEQDPGSDSEIIEFCQLNYGVTFQMMKKSDVNGPEANPIFKFLKEHAGFAGFDTTQQAGKFMDGMLSKQNPDYANNPDIKWNFTKFLVAKDGATVKRFEPMVTPEDMEAEIETMLK